MSETCGDCSGPADNDGIGSAWDAETGLPICKACSAKREEAYLMALKPGERGLLYWNGTTITDWMGGLRVTPQSVRVGRHNICGKQTYVWFRLGGKAFRGRHVGDDQILRVTAL